jgi:peptide-methionine (R)-S-oxide reductase
MKTKIDRITFSLLSPAVLLLLFACTETKEMPMNEFPVQKTDTEWREELTAEQFRILREAGTERPYTGLYTDHDEPGVYRCAGCGAELFTAESKFHSGCGWPAFDRAVSDGRVIERKDLSHGMIRTEVLCAACGGHLGHVFPDGPQETTGLRYCINSAALAFSREKDAGPSGKAE